MRILLVEDNPGDARLIDELFQELPDVPTTLCVVGSMSEARDSLKEEPAPDVILLDLGLPDTNGAETLAAAIPAAPSTPVVVLTGEEDEEMGLQAVRGGAQDYVRKQDLGARSLVRTIRYAIERKRAQNAERFLTEVGTLLATTLDYSEILERLSELAVHSLGEYCIIDMVAEDGSIRRLQVTHRDASARELTDQLSQHPFRRGDSSLLDTLETGQTVRVPHVTHADLRAITQDHEQLSILEMLRPRSYIAVPMFAKERLSGVILFVSTERSFDAEDQTLAEKLGRIAAPELANAHLYQLAQEAIRARDRVLGIVAHDLRNPLNAIAMSTTLLIERELSPEMSARQLQIIRRSTDRMDRLIQDLLDVVRIESEKLQVHPDHQNPLFLAREAVELNSAVAAARGLSLETESLSHRLLPVNADRDRILQVLSNLLGNAIKFTSEGGHVRVRVSQTPDQTTISVIDSGPGISYEDQANLFTPFWQARRISAEGAGLGLGIAKGIVEAHGGRIWVESEPGKGTTVSFTLRNSQERRFPTKAMASRLSDGSPQIGIAQ